ncbi:MAG: glycosyltransferase family 4 protein [Candidatus Margulisiibacteriota bacterium]
MHILILTEAFPPETKSASTLFFELAESLVNDGNQVSVITRKPRYNVAEGSNLSNLPAEENLSGIKVYRRKIPSLARDIPLIRGLEHFIIGWLFFWKGLWMEKFDAILIYSPPLPLGVAGILLGKLKRRPVVVNIQDLYPQTVIDLKLLTNPFLIEVSRWMESFIYRIADQLTVHSEGNRQYLIGKQARADKVKVIHNWVDTEAIKPSPRSNDFSRKYGLADKFVVSFAGVMGFAQGLEVVVEAADLLKEKRDIIFVLVGDGIKRPELQKLAQGKGLNNILFVPTQPLSIYPQILQASDICLVTLGRDLVTPVVPGKMLSIMAAGRPVLASLPLNGDAPKIIEEFQCGIAVEPSNPELLAQAILKLYNNRSLAEGMGKRGREAAEKHFSRKSCVETYEELFNGLQSRI